MALTVMHHLSKSDFFLTFVVIFVHNVVCVFYVGQPVAGELVIGLVLPVPLPHPGSEHAADGADAGDSAPVADILLEQAVADLPREDAAVLFLVVLDAFLDLWRGDARLGAADDAGPDGAGLLVALQDLADAAVAHPQLPADHTGPDALSRHLHDLQADMVGQGTTIDENAT